MYTTDWNIAFRVQSVMNIAFIENIATIDVSIPYRKQQHFPYYFIDSIHHDEFDSWI